MMKKIKLIILLLVTFSGYSQEPTLGLSSAEQAVQIPPSPEAQAFTKYGNSSVSMYTGSPDVAIPIHTIQGKDIQVPINLTYDASGIKVNQLATWVGLGWNLNVGGVVTRQQIGKPDDWIQSFPQYQLYYSDAIINGSYSINDEYEFAKTFVPGDWKSAGEYNRYYDFLDKVQSGLYESQSDTYSFNVNGLSGTLFIDYSDMTVSCMEHPGLNIEVQYDTSNPNNRVITGWVIIDTQGTKYTFNMVEETLVRQNNENDDYQVYNSSWFISKIESERDVIDFEYEAPQKWTKPQFTGSTAVYTDNNNNNNQDDYSTGSLPTYEITQSELKTIKVNGVAEVILNTASQTRLDLEGRKALSSIEIRNVLGEQIRKYELGQSYYGTDMTDEYALRLKLDELRVFGNQNSIDPQTYAFDYISGDLPRRDSFSQDFWGYYNGKPNETLIPYNEYFDRNNNPFQGADRTPNFNTAQIGTLREITYPTGGSTNFYYQPHKSDQIVWEEEEIEVEYSIGLLGGEDPNDPYNFFQCDDAYGAYDTKPKGTDGTIEVSETTTYTFDINAAGTVVPLETGKYQFIAIYKSGELVTCDTPPGGGPEICQFTDQVEEPCNFIDPTGPTASAEFLVFDQLIENYSYSMPLTLSPGKYRIIMLNSDENISMSLQMSKVVTTQYDEVGGLRVFKVEDKSDSNAVASTRFYHYGALSQLPSFDSSLFGGSNGSGTLHLPPIFETTITSTGWGTSGTQQYTPISTQKVQRGSNNQARGDHFMTYPVVTEIAYDSTFNAGYTENYFHNQKTTYTVAAFSKKTINNGKLIKRKIFDASKGLVQEEQQHYSTISLGSFVSFGISAQTLNNPNSVEDRYIYSTVENSSMEIVEVKDQSNSATGVSRCGWEGRFEIVFLTTGKAEYDEKKTEATVIKDQWIAEGKADVQLNSHLDNWGFIPRYGWHIVSYKEYDIVSCKQGPFAQPEIAKHLLPKWWSRLDSVETIQYLDNGNMESKTVYTYDPNEVHFQLVEKKSFDSEGAELVNKFFYPADINGLSAMDGLLTRNNISELIKTEQWRNGELQSTSQIDYNYFGTQLLPSALRKSIKNNPLEVEFQFIDYDLNGNPAEIHSRDGVAKTFLWGYNGSTPVFQVQNATEVEVNAVLANHGMSDVNLLTDAQLTQAGQFLRDDLPHALVTSYTHYPGIGVRTMTDPNGLLSYYEFDDFNRLHIVRDGRGTSESNGNILAMHNYNFDQSYQRSHSYLTPRTSILTETASMALASTEVNIVTQYIDGLGRPVQSVQKNGSVTNADIVQHIAYDGFGRQVQEYLPFTSGNDGLKKTAAENEQLSFYTNLFGSSDGSMAYAEIEYEESPLGRTMKSFAPGQAWAKNGGNRPVVSNYRTNESGDQVRIWKIGSGQNPVESTEEYQNADLGGAGMLYVTSITDENGNLTLEFKDKLGQVVLKKVQESSTTFLSTYYVYDELNNLRFVLPPEAVKAAESNGHNVSQTILDQYGFYYEYDHRNRMTTKKVPGAAEVHMVYDTRDRLIMTQDGNQRNLGEWTFTKYDQLNRPAITGIFTDNTAGHDRDYHQTQVDNMLILNVSDSDEVDNGYLEGVFIETNNYDGESTIYRAEQYIHLQSGFQFDSGTGGSLQAYIQNPIPNIEGGWVDIYYDKTYPDIYQAEVLTVSYYDNYGFTNETFQLPGGVFTAIDGKLPEFNDKVKGQLTGTKTKILGSASDFIRTVTFYDDRYQMIQSVTVNQHGGKEILTSHFDFAGRLRMSYFEHNNPLADVASNNITMRYTYDHAGRMLTMEHSLNGNSYMILSNNSYNELSELVTKEIGDAAQTVDYEYNMRGWLTKMNDPGSAGSADYFSMALKYNDATQAQYNGNIGEISWRDPFETEEKNYQYLYDPVNRITDADYSTSLNNDNAFRVHNITYDGNGNILTLNRYHKNLMVDQLDYTYEGNQLVKVEDLSSNDEGFKDGADLTTEYLYDANGNMEQDENKDIASITYII